MWCLPQLIFLAQISLNPLKVILCLLLGSGCCGCGVILRIAIWKMDHLEVDDMCVYMCGWHLQMPTNMDKICYYGRPYNCWSRAVIEVIRISTNWAYLLLHSTLSGCLSSHHIGHWSQCEGADGVSRACTLYLIGGHSNHSNSCVPLEGSNLNTLTEVE